MNNEIKNKNRDNLILLNNIDIQQPQTLEMNNLEENNIINIENYETIKENQNNNNIIPQFNYIWFYIWLVNIIKNSKINIK